MGDVSYDTAKQIAVGLLVGFIVLSVVSVIVIRNIVVKLASAALLVALALGVWSQRSSLQDCADRVRDRVEAGVRTDLECSFFGTDVAIPT